jgi:hypothetical protein
MIKEELAEMLNGIEYGTDIPQETQKLAKEHGLAIVYGHSDDLMEFEGAIEDEISCYGGGLALIVVPKREYSLYDEDEEKTTIEVYDNYGVVELEEESASRENVIEAKWCEPLEIISGNEPVVSWQYKTDISHTTFNIIENDEIYCRGIIFALSDLK